MISPSRQSGELPLPDHDSPPVQKNSPPWARLEISPGPDMDDLSRSPNFRAIRTNKLNSVCSPEFMPSHSSSKKRKLKPSEHCEPFAKRENSQIAVLRRFLLTRNLICLIPTSPITNRLRYPSRLWRRNRTSNRTENLLFKDSEITLSVHLVSFNVRHLDINQ